MFFVFKMKRKWNVIYYETSDKRCPITDFIDSRRKRNQAKVLSLISLLHEYGPHLSRPYADLLTDGIHELRIKLSGENIRILYFFCYRDFIVLTHTFIKTVDKVPKSEIKKAQKYRDDFLLNLLYIHLLSSIKSFEFFLPRKDLITIPIIVCTSSKINIKDSCSGTYSHS